MARGSQQNYAASIPFCGFFSGEGPRARRVSIKSLISSANSDPSADETHLDRKRSSWIPLNANNGLRKRIRLFVA